jgi:hypothetical protein
MIARMEVQSVAVSFFEEALEKNRIRARRNTLRRMNDRENGNSTGAL